MSLEIQQIGISVQVLPTAIVACLIGGFLSMLPVSLSGSLARATRTGGLMELRKTIRLTVLWAGLVGTVIGLGAVGYFVTRDPVLEITAKHHLWIAVGSGIAGFIVGMGFFGYFCENGHSV